MVLNFADRSDDEKQIQVHCACCTRYVREKTATTENSRVGMVPAKKLVM